MSIEDSEFPPPMLESERIITRGGQPANLGFRFECFQIGSAVLKPEKENLQVQSQD